MTYERLTERDKKREMVNMKNCPFEDCENCMFHCQEKWDAIKRLAELEDKIESGQAVILPCNVGDKVYGVNKDIHRVIYGTFFFAEITKYAHLYYIFDERMCRYSVDFMFTTKEAAEAKLKELTGE